MSGQKSKMAKIEDATWKEKIDTALSCLDINTISYLYENKHIGPDPRINNKSVLTRACEAGNASVVQFLLDKGADPNISKYDMPLCVVCQSGREDIAGMLIEHGANVNMRDFCTNSPLFYACKNAQAGILRLLLRNGAEVGSITYKDTCDNPLYMACISGFKEIVRILVDDRDQRGERYDDYKNEQYYHPMFAAFSNDNHGIVKYFLEKEIRLDENLDKGDTVLHAACRFNAPDIVTNLISRGANINKGNDRGETPLHVACRGERRAVIKILLDNNANHAIPDIYGMYPIDLVDFEYSKTGIEIIRMMLKYGVSLTKNIAPRFHCRLMPYYEAQVKLSDMLLIREHCPDSLLGEDYLPRDLFKLICKAVVVEQGRAPFENHIKSVRDRPWTAKGLLSVKLELLRETADQEKVDYSYKDKKQELIAKMLDHDASGA